MTNLLYYESYKKQNNKYYVCFHNIFYVYSGNHYWQYFLIVITLKFVILKRPAPIKGFSSDERWKVIVNTEIEIDE